MGTIWRGMLAPLNTSTGDGRRFLAAGLTFRELPLALKWQRADVQGHDGSIVIGSLLTLNVGTVAAAVDNQWIDTKCIEKSKLSDDLMAVWGTGELFDDLDITEFERLVKDVAEAKLLLEKGVIGPSVEPGEVIAAIVEKGSDTPLSEEALDDLFWGGEDDVELETLFTSYQIAAASLVSVPAFEECRPFELLPTTTITAAVRGDGWSDFPLADRELEWTVEEAEPRIAIDAGIGTEDADWERYAQAFLYTDENMDPATKGAYGFQILDLIDDTRTIVPRAVFAVAGVLSGARGGTTIPQADQDAMRTVVEELYARMADEWDDPTVVAPWIGSEESIIAARSLYGRLTAAAPTYAESLFGDPGLSAVTPITITDSGEVLGHAATHDVCHVGIPGECVTAPVTSRGYADFNRYSLPTETGGEVLVGRITVGHARHVCSCGLCRGHNDDHACLSLGAHGAIGHHDELSTVAWVRAGEDTTNNAIWVHGVINPSATTEDLAVLTRGRVSGDWRPIGGNSELIEVLALSRERAGYPLPRARMLSGQVTALTAAGFVRPVSATNDGPTLEIDYERLTDLLAGKLASRLSTTPTAAPDTTQLVVDTGELREQLESALDDGDTAIAERLRAELERIF